MGLVATLFLLGLSLALAGFCGWRGALPPDPRRGVRLLPYRFLMILFVAAALLMLIHLLNLWGVSTGR